MSVSESGDRRNLEGFASLKKRFIRRATSVAQSVEFRTEVQRLRNLWNQGAPRYRIVPVATEEELRNSPLIDYGMGACPAGLRQASLQDPWEDDEGFTYMTWVNMVDSLCDAFWPPRFFDIGFTQTGRYPFEFVSACFFLSPLEVGERAPEFFREIRLAPIRLPYEPGLGDRHKITCLEGQVEYLMDFIRNRLDLSEEQMGDLDLQSSTAGEDRARNLQITNWWHSDPSKNMWYLPLYPGISTTDIRKVVGEVVEAVGGAYGTRRLDETIHTLRAEGMTQQRIADLLGISKDAVMEALKLDLPDETR